MATAKKAAEPTAEQVAQATEQAVEQNTEQDSFSKGQIVASAKFANRKDLVDALLDEKKSYTMEQVDKLVNDYMKGKVN